MNKYILFWFRYYCCYYSWCHFLEQFTLLGIYRVPHGESFGIFISRHLPFLASKQNAAHFWQFFARLHFWVI